MINEPVYKLHMTDAEAFGEFMDSGIKIYPLPNDIFGIQVEENTILVTAEEYTKLFTTMYTVGLSMGLLGVEDDS